MGGGFSAGALKKGGFLQGCFKEDLDGTAMNTRGSILRGWVPGGSLLRGWVPGGSILRGCVPGGSL